MLSSNEFAFFPILHLLFLAKAKDWFAEPAISAIEGRYVHDSIALKETKMNEKLSEDAVSIAAATLAQALVMRGVTAGIAELNDRSIGSLYGECVRTVRKTMKKD